MADNNQVLKIGLVLAALLGIGYYLKNRTLTPYPSEPGEFEGDRVFIRDGFKIREG